MPGYTLFKDSVGVSSPYRTVLFYLAPGHLIKVFP